MPRATSPVTPVFDLPNLRDVGGLPTVDGRRVRHGRLFRGPTLARAGEHDLATLAAIGLRTVVDLRSAWERERAPEAQRLPVGVRYVVADVNGAGVVSVASCHIGLRTIPAPCTSATT